MLVIVGGDPRPDHRERLKEAFDLRSVRWVEMRETDASVRRCIPHLNDDTVGLVVVLIGLVRHNHSREIPRLCAKSNRAVVRYRGKSPHPNGLAEAIIRQVGRRLGIRRTPTSASSTR